MISVPFLSLEYFTALSRQYRNVLYEMQSQLFFIKCRVVEIFYAYYLCFSWDLSFLLSRWDDSKFAYVSVKPVVLASLSPLLFEFTGVLSFTRPTICCNAPLVVLLLGSHATYWSPVLDWLAPGWVGWFLIREVSVLSILLESAGRSWMTTENLLNFFCTANFYL